MRYFFLIILLCFFQRSGAQFAPQYPIAGNDAISKFDSRIVGWASNCVVQRGYQDMANPGLGFVFNGTELNTLGPSNNQVMSLGDGGMATLQFAVPISNGAGPDFAIFENGFIYALDTSLAYLELAKVSVSSDGVHFVTFPSINFYSDSAQLNNASAMDARMIHNLAGKYVAGQGTPFDLAELADSPSLDIYHISHVRVIDVVGSLNDSFASYDSRGEKINDPYTTAFPGGGFDLECVAVLNQSGSSALAPIEAYVKLQAYPNPAKDYVVLPQIAGELLIYNQLGQLKWSGKNQTLDVRSWDNGLYFLKASGEFSSLVVVH